MREKHSDLKIQYPPLLLREQCSDRERSEDTLPNLLRNVNRSASARVFPRSLTSCQRAEVKRVLHCDATTSVDMDALLSETIPAPGIFSLQQLQIHPTTERILCTLSSDSISTSAMASKGYPSFCIWKAISCFVEAFPNSLPSVIPSSFP